MYIFYMQLMLLQRVGVADRQQNMEGPGPSKVTLKTSCGPVDGFESKKKKEKITDPFIFLNYILVQK